MKKTFYILKNNSSSVGLYLYKGEYIQLFPNKEVVLENKPTNFTSNLVETYFNKTIEEKPVNSTSKDSGENKSKEKGE